MRWTLKMEEALWGAVNAWRQEIICISVLEVRARVKTMIISCNGWFNVFVIVTVTVIVKRNEFKYLHVLQYLSPTCSFLHLNYNIYIRINCTLFYISSPSFPWPRWILEGGSLKRGLLGFPIAPYPRAHLGIWPINGRVPSSWCGVVLSLTQRLVWLVMQKNPWKD